MPQENYVLEFDLSVQVPTVSQQFVLDAIARGALTFPVGGRKLKSGRISPYFFNSGLYCDGESLCALAEAYAETLTEQYNDLEGYVLFGPAYKGITLVAATAMYLYDQHAIKVFVANNRKEAKDHGEGGVLMGAVKMAGTKVIVMDDVITTGESKREAVELIRAASGEVFGGIIAFDRQERGEKSDLSGAQEFEKEFGVSMDSIADLSVLIDVLEIYPDKQGVYHRGILSALLAYRAEYGVKV